MEDENKDVKSVEEAAEFQNELNELMDPQTASADIAEAFGVSKPAEDVSAAKETLANDLDQLQTVTVPGADGGTGKEKDLKVEDDPIAKLTRELEVERTERKKLSEQTENLNKGISSFRKELKAKDAELESLRTGKGLDDQIDPEVEKTIERVIEKIQRALTQ